MAFKSKLKIVDQLTIGSPCPDESFENNAKALDTGWYCNMCSKEVYDLKKMSKSEIAKLVKNKKGNFCAVISRRQDGSMITKEPVSATNAFLSTGLLLASTTLISSQAIAETERGDVALPSQSNSAQLRGEVYVPPSSSEGSQSSEGSTCSDKSSASEEAQVEPVGPIHRTVGAVAIEPTRGKVAIKTK
jgi:hypothetical protein